MYELDQAKLERGCDRLEKLFDQTGCAPLVIPLGKDTQGIYHYRMITWKGAPGVISDQVVSLGVSEQPTDHQHIRNVIEFGGCTCIAGERDEQCYHVSEVYPVHKTFQIIDGRLELEL